MHNDLYLNEAPKDGPAVFIVAGIHGNEPAGVLAATQLAEEITPGKGKLLILPRANVPAIEAERRYLPGEMDLNRVFPVEIPENPTEELAQEIYSLIQEHSLDVIIDLHESREFYSLDPNRVGQTIIFNEHPVARAIVQRLLEEINQMLPEREQFTCLFPTTEGSLTRAAAQEGLLTFIFETTKKLPLQNRIFQHKTLVILTLGYLGMLDKKCPKVKKFSG